MNENKSGKWQHEDTHQSDEQMNNSTEGMSRANRHTRTKTKEASWFSRVPKKEKVTLATEKSDVEQFVEEGWEEVSNTRSTLPLWARSIFWFIRKCFAPIVMIVMLMAGLYIGYVVMGGQSKEEVFEFSTYKHMWDLIFAES